jgi:hypothetical protein
VDASSRNHGGNDVFEQISAVANIDGLDEG